MKTPWKFKLTCFDQMVEMPEGAEILCIQTQDSVPCIWAVVDTTRPLTTRRFRTYATGQALPEAPERVEQLQHVGTYQIPGAGEVWHVFEVSI